jgi:hypothetical protein
VTRIPQDWNSQYPLVDSRISATTAHLLFQHQSLAISVDGAICTPDGKGSSPVGGEERAYVQGKEAAACHGFLERIRIPWFRNQVRMSSGAQSSGQMVVRTGNQYAETEEM